MAIPETQLTIRIPREDLVRFQKVQAHLALSAPVAPREADIHRAIYARGLSAMEMECGFVLEEPPAMDGMDVIEQDDSQ